MDLSNSNILRYRSNVTAKKKRDKLFIFNKIESVHVLIFSTKFYKSFMINYSITNYFVFLQDFLAG